MILISSYLNVADNSGARYVKCIRNFEKRNNIEIGDILLVIVKKINPQKKIAKSSFQKCIVVRLKKLQIRNGGYIRTSENAVVLLKKNLLPLVRVFLALFLEIYVSRESLLKFCLWQRFWYNNNC